jgi:3-oxoacyl-[acyl-carrier protein] reductase
VNIGSVAANRVVSGQSVYSATKGAVAAFTRSLAYEYGRKGIRVNCIEPGPVETPMMQTARELAEEALLNRIPLRRLGAPQDVAELAVFLMSDRASFITGASFTADGGYAL